MPERKKLHKFKVLYLTKLNSMHLTSINLPHKYLASSCSRGSFPKNTRQDIKASFVRVLSSCKENFDPYSLFFKSGHVNPKKINNFCN